VVLDTRSVSEPEKSQQAVFRAYPLKLVRGRNIIHATALNGDNNMRSNEAEWEVTASYAAAAGPSLAALAIGVGEYGDPQIKLPYAAAGAELVAGAFKGAGEGIFAKAEIKALTRPEETTAEAILREMKAFQTLRAEDLFVFYISGFAVVEEGEYFLVTSNVNSLSAEKLKTDAIALRKLQEALGNIPAAKKLILIDACNPRAQSADAKIPSQTRARNEETALKIFGGVLGSTVLASSSPLPEALEGYQGHGLFTYVLTEGLKGKADKSKTGYIKTTELADYVDNEVPLLAEKVFQRAQYPTISISGQAFPVGKVK
jgi:uncharacterized caspase-like protein